MKWFIRLFFRTVRRVIGPVMLFIDWITTPKGIDRPEPEQQRIDAMTQSMSLYQFKTCPFCIKVRREMKRLSLNIELRDAQNDEQFRQELLQQGGQIKVPCLRITDANGENTWLYESDDIIHFLNKAIA